MTDETPTPRETVIQNEYGFHQVKPTPSAESLQEFYRDLYFQKNHGTYKRSYSDIDRQNRDNRLSIKSEAIAQLGVPLNTALPKRFLDVGCGEGWALSYWFKHGWDVTGVDFSTAACQNHNPELAKTVITGEIEESLNELIRQGYRFDLLWLDNVLEHARDPELLLHQLHQLAGTDAILAIEVPNDFSPLQALAMDSGLIDREFWVCPPQHLQYFNLTGLDNLLQAMNWSVVDAFSDFPIDWFLMNPASNYVKDASVGRGAHEARTQLESLMLNQSAERILEVYRGLAQMGLGRNINVLARPK